MPANPEIGGSEVDRAIGRAIQRERRRQGMSRETMARLTACSVSDIERYDAGLERISADLLIRMARALDCKVSELLPPV